MNTHIPTMNGWLAVPVVIASSLVSSQSTASLRGRVLLDSGSPLQGAIVAFNRIPELGHTQSGKIVGAGLAYSAEGATGADGSFLVGGIPIGDYYVCAAGPAQNHLRSCDWGVRPTLVHLTGTSADQPVTLSVTTGAVLTVAITDPGNVIKIGDVTGRLAAQTNVIVSVFSSNFMRNMQFTGRNGATATYTLAVPTGTPLRLMLDANPKFAITDDAGSNVLTRKPAVTVNVPTSGLTLGFSISATN
jgi:hypothetical protein